MRRKIIPSENLPESFPENIEKEEEKMSVKKVEFPNLSGSKGAGLDPSTFGNIPIQISVELGQAQMSLKEVLELSEGSIVELDRLAGEPLDLKVGDELIAKGEVVAVDNNYGLRITSTNLNK